MSRMTWLAVGAVSIALLSGCAADTDEQDAEGSGPSMTQGNSAKSPIAVELTLPTEGAGRCMPPNVENLQAQDTAFEGTVTALDDGQATLEVTTVYAGSPGDTATVAVPSQDLTDLILAVDLRQGETYLISSLEGEISVCGLSGPKDAPLEGLYQEAYGS